MYFSRSSPKRDDIPQGWALRPQVPGGTGCRSSACEAMPPGARAARRERAVLLGPAMLSPGVELPWEKARNHPGTPLRPTQPRQETDAHNAPILYRRPTG